MKFIGFMALAFLAAHRAIAADPAKLKPEFQYESVGIQVSLARADEPRVASFNAGTIKAAAKYLDDGAICWVREKTFVNCHTTGPYMSERPSLSRWLGKPNDEVLRNFVDTPENRYSRRLREASQPRIVRQC